MDVKSIVNKTKQLAPTPQILPKLRSLLQDGNSSVNDIISLIKLDQSLAAQIVRVSNGAFYGAQKPSQNLEDAVNRIGFNEVYKLVAFVASSQVLSGSNELYGLEGNTLWLNSVSCATLMQHIAQIAGEDSDTAYTIGLMHAIGKVAINGYYTANKIPFPEQRFSQDNPSFEREVLGFDYAQVGAELLSNWKFQTDITLPIQQQFQPENCPQSKRLAYLLVLAKQALPLLQCRPQDIAQNFEVSAEISEETGTEEDEIICAIMAAKAALLDINDLLNAV